MIRYIVATILGGGVTFGLFYLMQWLILMDNPRIGERGKAGVIEFIRVQKDSAVQANERKLPDKAPPPEPPPPPDLTIAESDAPEDSVDAVNFEFEMGLDGGIGVGGAQDAQRTPLVRIAPEMPERAAQRGIEGWVVVEFTITKTGSVKDPRVLESSSNMFERSALRAIRKWRYNPEMVDGKAVEVHGEKVKLTFVIDDDKKA